MMIETNKSKMSRGIARCRVVVHDLIPILYNQARASREAKVQSFGKRLLEAVLICSDRSRRRCRLLGT